jgi:predicted DsbA family dithiol-disulfide isomerase
MSKDLTVIVAHDYQCPWSYLSLFQAQKLKKDFPQLTLDWRGYELVPNGKDDLAERPQPSERFKTLSKLDGLPMPLHWPEVITAHAPLEGAEYVKENKLEAFDQYNEAVYRAFWEEGKDISDLKILETIAKNIGLDTNDFLQSIAAKKYAGKIIPFREAAYADGITHVTAFRFRGEQCAEAPYSTIRDLTQRFIAWYDK